MAFCVGCFIATILKLEATDDILILFNIIIARTVRESRAAVEVLIAV